MSAGACSSAGSRLPSPSPDSRFLALRFAAQEATDFGMDDEKVRRFVELRDQAASDDAIAQELGVDAEVVTALVKADDAQVVAHRIADLLPHRAQPLQRVVDGRSGSSAVPLAVLVVVLLGVIVYALVR